MAASCAPWTVKCALTRFNSPSSSVSSGSTRGGDWPYAPSDLREKRGGAVSWQKLVSALSPRGKPCSTLLSFFSQSSRDTEGEEKQQRKRRRRCSVLAHTPPLSLPSGRRALWHNWLLISLQPVLNLCSVCTCVRERMASYLQ